MSSDVFLVSPPRLDWRVQGNANVFSVAAGASGAAADVPGAALREWMKLVDMIADRAPVGVMRSDDPALTGMPYTAEAGALGLDEKSKKPVFLVANVKPAHRKGEAPHIERFFASCRTPTRPTTALWEGQGDVIDASGRFICTSGEGAYARTSADAYAEISPFLPGPSLHLRFRADPWFHGNTFLGVYAHMNARIVVVCEEALLDGEAQRLRDFLPGARFVVITREESMRYATNALQVSDRVYAPGHLPSAMRDALKAIWLTVVEVELPLLFGRGGGAAVCLTNRMKGMPVDLLPDSARYQNARKALLAELG